MNSFFDGSKTKLLLKTFYCFLRLYDTSFQNNVKSRVFWKLKKRKIRILEHWFAAHSAKIKCRFVVSIFAIVYSSVLHATTAGNCNRWMLLERFVRRRWTRQLIPRCFLILRIIAFSTILNTYCVNRMVPSVGGYRKYPKSRSKAVEFGPNDSVSPPSDGWRVALSQHLLSFLLVRVLKYFKEYAIF